MVLRLSVTNSLSFSSLLRALKTPKCSELEALFKREPHELLLSASDPRSKLMGAVYNSGSKKQDISIKHIPVIWKILAKVVSCTDSNEALNNFLRQMLATPFFTDRLPHFVQNELMEMVLRGNEALGVGHECLKHMLQVLLACFDRMPNIAYDKVHLVVSGLHPIISQLEKHEGMQVDADTKSIFQVNIAEIALLIVKMKLSL